MGGRKLRSWVSFPLLDIEEITRRQDAVEYFFRDVACRDRCEEALRRVGDLERLMAKLASNRIGAEGFCLVARFSAGGRHSEECAVGIRFGGVCRDVAGNERYFAALRDYSPCDCG